MEYMEFNIRLLVAVLWLVFGAVSWIDLLHSFRSFRWSVRTLYSLMLIVLIGIGVLLILTI